METPRPFGAGTLVPDAVRRTFLQLRRTVTRNPFAASEGVPFLFGMASFAVVVWHFGGFLVALLPLAALGFLYLIFRDPHRPVPAVPLGVVSPVDGEIIRVGPAESPVLDDEAQTISIRVNSLGTYTARCPVEGKIMDLSTNGSSETMPIGSGGLWVRTDEGDDVILRFRNNRLGLAPRAFIRYGERVGQGQRCAFLRLTGVAEVQVPAAARLQVETGQRVTAGSDVLAKLPHH